MDDLTSLADLLFASPTSGSSLLVHVAGADGAGGADHRVDDVKARAAAVAAALSDAGVPAGAPVGVMLPNGVGVVAALFGVWRVGAVYVPLNPRLGPTDLAHAMAAARPAAVVTSASDAARFAGLPLVVVDGAAVSVRPGPIGDRRLDADVALVQFTSGTTDRPKPVLLTHSGVLALLDNVVATLRPTSPARTKPPKPPMPPMPPMPNLVPVSLSLWAGIYQVLFAFRVGAPVVVMDGFATSEFSALVARFGIRSTVLPPAAMAMLTDDEAVTSLAPLEYVRSITAPLSPFQARRFRDRFGIAVLNSYGQTEIGGEIVGWSAADSKAFGDAKLGSVGRAHAGVEVRTDPPTGELQVRTPALAAGYADGADLSDRLTADGWFRTGDVGRVDGDGFVWIDGRLGDMINRGGLKVSPAEVEEVLRGAPGVADVAVAGRPDERLGEVPWAFVVASTEADPPAAADLADHCRAHLAPYKVPARFVFLATLPRNEAGKVLTHVLAGRTVT